MSEAPCAAPEQMVAAAREASSLRSGPQGIIRSAAGSVELHNVDSTHLTREFSQLIAWISHCMAQDEPKAQVASHSKKSHSISMP